MKLSEQVCALEQAKKLYALGVERRSLFYHFHGRIEHEAFGSEYYSAFTVAELGVMIPAEYFLPSNKDGAWWMSHGMTFEKTEAEARATMLIQLLQANKVTPAEVNQRLTQK